MVHSHMKRHIQSPPDTFQTPYRHPTDTLQTPSRLRLNVCVNSIKCLSHFGRIVYMGWHAPLLTATEERLFEQRILLNSSSIEKEGNLVPKKEEIWRKKRRCSHMGNCAESTENPPSPPRTSTPPCLLVICRHLYIVSNSNHFPIDKVSHSKDHESN